MQKLLELQANRIETTLELHRINARVTGGTVTPRWVRFLVLPALGTKLSRLVGLHQEIAAALGVSSCLVSRRGAAVAIEVPRDDPKPVRLLPLYDQLADQSIPPIVAILGLAEDGVPLLIRLSSPDVAHILVAGTTGSGKTVLLQTMVLSLAMANLPNELALVLIDPKAHAFRAFDGLPHLARPVATDLDEIATVLRDLIRLMEQRTSQPTGQQIKLVVVIDELADLLIVSEKDVQHALTRLTQRGREAGIHVIAATQKPTAEVIGSLVKANFPVRLVGRVTSIEDARTATGWSGTGAERLMGRGDFLVVAEGRVNRFQAAHVTRAEIRERVSRITAPPVAISWPTIDELEEPDENDELVHKLIVSDLWPKRHGNNGAIYQRGFMSNACDLLFEQPLAGVYYTRTKEILTLAESTSDTKSSTTTTEKPTTPAQVHTPVLPSSSSREKRNGWVRFNARSTPRLPLLVHRPPPQKRTSAPLRLRVASLRSHITAPPQLLDIQPEQAIIAVAILSGIAGYGIRTIVQLIGELP